MSIEAKSPWNSLEITKLAVGALTPILIFIFGLVVNHSVQSAERESKQAELRRERSEARQEAVQNLSRFIYERRSRAEMLASALRRNISIEEIADRKRLYDEAYVNWNRNHQANLLLIRQLIGERQYSELENLMEFQLVGEIFRPLDTCLTTAYDARVRGQSASAVLDECSVRVLLQRSLDCGYAFTDELFKLTTFQPGDAERTIAANSIIGRCESRPQPDAAGGRRTSGSH